jgi:hypothetical protein
MSHEIFIECTSPIITQFQNEHACSGDFGHKISQNTANLAHLPTIGGSYWCSYYESLQASWKPLGPKSGFGLLLKKGFWLNFEDLDFYSPLGVVSMCPIFSLKKARIWHLGTTRQPLPPPHDTRGSNFELVMSRKAWGIYVVILKHHLDHLNRGYGLRIGGMVDLPSPTICEKVNFTSLILGNEEWLYPSPLPLFMILGVIFWLVLVKKGQRSTRRHAKTSFVSFEDGIWS